MDKKIEYNERNCLASALTLLVKHNVFTEKEAIESIDTEGYEGLYNLINKYYKKWHEENN